MFVKTFFLLSLGKEKYNLIDIEFKNFFLTSNYLAYDVVALYSSKDSSLGSRGDFLPPFYHLNKASMVIWD